MVGRGEHALCSSSLKQDTPPPPKIPPSLAILERHSLQGVQGGSGHPPHRCWGTVCSLPGKRNQNIAYDPLLPTSRRSPQPGSPNPGSPAPHTAPSLPRPCTKRRAVTELRLLLGKAVPCGDSATTLPGDPSPLGGLQENCSRVGPFPRDPHYRRKLLSSGAEPHHSTQLLTEIHRFGHKAGLGIYRHSLSSLQFNQCFVFRQYLNPFQSSERLYLTILLKALR